MRLSPILGALVAAVLQLSSPAVAQDEESPEGDPAATEAPETEAERVEAARRAFELGRAATDAGLHDEASGHFARSLALVPHLSTAYNLAVASRLSGHREGAAALLERILSGEFGALERAQRADVQSQLAALRRELARVVLRVGGIAESAWIEVDGGARAPLASPHLLWFLPGEHRIRIGAGGARDTTLELELDGGEDRDVTLSLAPRNGRLVVEAERATETILIDGEERGRGRAELELEEGTYRATIAGCEACTRDVDVRAGTETRVVLARSAERDDTPWIVTLVVVGAAVVAGAATGIGVALASEAREAPFSDPVFGVVVALETP